MVTVDDATYVKMKDTLYGGDAGKASKAKAKIESSYTQQQYDNLVSKLGGMGTTQQTTTPKPSNMDAGSSTIQQTTTPSRNMQTETPVKQQEMVGNTVSNIQQQGALKPLSQDYYNQTSSNALDVIKNNLNSYKQSNPEYFNNYEDYKKNFSYDSRNQEQKDVLDNFYNQYQKGLTLSSTPVNDLYTQYKDGQISLADLELLKGNNPTKYAELQNQINKASILTAYDDTTPTEKMNFQDIAYQMIANSLNMINSGDYGASKYFSQLEEKMNSPEMMELQDKTTELNEQYKNIEDQIASIGKDVEEEYEGTGATKSKINAIIADRTYDLQQQLRTLGNEYEKYATQYNNRATQYQNEFQLQLQEYQVNMQARNQQMSELGFAMDLMNFETNDQKQQREWDYWVKQQEYENGNINSKDYQTRYKAALKSVQNLLSQYEGIPMQRSAEQMAQDILKAIDGGSDLGAELTKINKQIQGKPEYKYLYNQTYATTTTGGIQETMKVGDTEYVKYNGQWMTADDFNKNFNGVSNANAKPYEVVSEEKFSINPAKGGLGAFLMDNKNAAGNTGGWCGAFVNRYLKQIGASTSNYYDDSLQTKVNSVNTQTPKVGSIAVYDYGHITKETGQNHGHVGIVVAVHEDGTYDVMDSNFGGDKKIQIRRNLNPNSTSLKGFFDPSKGASNTTDETQSFVSGSIEGVPLAYERAVKNLVPAALQNSDAEREALNTIITNSYKGGIDQSEIALKFMGFDIKNDSDKTLATDLVNTIRTLTTDTQEGIVQTISDLMNQGKYDKAIQTVENAVSKQAKEAGNYVSELSVKNTINKSNDLSNYINSLSKSPVGVVKGTMQEWLGKLSSKDAKELANKIALVESSLDIKDQETLKRIVPQLSDQPSVFMSKLENLNNSLMSELNGWRNIYGLPSLTSDSLTNISDRVSLYKNGTISGNSSSATRTTTQGVTKQDTARAIANLKAMYGLK